MKAISPDTINKQSENLMKEFYQHLDDCTKANPDMSDQRIVFEGWAIQKIASLQLMVAQQAGVSPEQYTEIYLVGGRSEPETKT